MVDSITGYEHYVFFWGGEFSQWHKCNVQIDGTIYNCTEQYMMAKKAAMFGDVEVLEAILKSNSPSDQKKLGRSVRGFDAAKWDLVSREFVYEANYAKFTQNKRLKELLLSTGDKLLVEASPYDKIWGIGMAETDPDILDQSKWKGLNWLGQVITQVREDIKLTLTK